MLRRSLSFIFTTVTFLLMTSAALAQESGQVTVTGTFIKNVPGENWLGLKTSSGHIYKLSPDGGEVVETLSKLENGDLISGFGQIDNSSKVAFLQSLSFIGLKRLLGFWWTNMGFVEVRTFSEMNFYTQSNSSSTFSEPTTKKSYQYSVSPSSTNSWVIFLSDDKAVYYTSMEFQGSHAKMKMYNPETGVLMKTIEFTRINN